MEEVESTQRHESRAAEREAAIAKLLPLVRQLARRLVRVVGRADIDDVVSDGSLGLIRAVDTFDPSRGTTLELYARKLIVGSMLNGLRRLDPVSERVRRTLRGAEIRRYELAQQLGTLPSLGALERDYSGLRRARMVAHRQAALSLDAPLPGGGEPVVDWSGDPERQAARRAEQRELREAVALLPLRQQRILALHYTNDLTLHAISSRLSVSPQRVSQLHLNALARLRNVVSK
jgi:RNA polymerase sigma factor for flagellar operon FliA